MATTTATILRAKGYVTTLSAIQGRGASDLEPLLGFAPGSLRLGFTTYALAEPVGASDFEWKDRTTYSAGWHFDP